MLMICVVMIEGLLLPKIQPVDISVAPVQGTLMGLEGRRLWVPSGGVVLYREVARHHHSCCRSQGHHVWLRYIRQKVIRRERLAADRNLDSIVLPPELDRRAGC